MPEFAGNCDDCHVLTEVKIPGRRPDIVIQGRNLCVVVENKTNTCDHYMQLADYRDWVNNQRAAYKTLLYLTYEGYPASDTNIAPEEYQSISYTETVCNWLQACAKLKDTPAADFCRQYAEFIQKTVIPEGIMNNEMTEKILENIDSFKAANSIHKSFDNARFQILKNLIRECWDGSEAVNADDKSCSIVLPGKSYKIAVQYDGGKPYYGIARSNKKADFEDFCIAGFEAATAWWIAWKYINGKNFQRNWSDADFLAEQWQKDNFVSFKNFIKECIDEVKNALDANSEKIDAYSSEM